ncbi:SIR2 family protein [Enterococcus innesii]|uniref:SIR2 family protein n=1 Tax=Enterococcus innesii TaxID=2839759 RepID=UPI0022B9D352|nr:SIR2 family protein [Enterococcus innesii]
MSLNTIAINIQGISQKEQFLNYFRVYLNTCEAEKLFLELIHEGLIQQSIQYECYDEFHSAIVLQENCKYCRKKIEEHEYYNMFEIKFKEALRNYNMKLMNSYFKSGSDIVIRDLRNNMHRVIPFVGAGISKALGFPLWKELFLYARDDIPEKYVAVFDKRYEDGEIDKLIECILEFNPLIQDEKDLKSRIIKPQIVKKLTNEEIDNSILPNLLSLDAEYILTTNYDNTLEQCNKLKGNGYEITNNILNFEGFENLVNQKYIFHLHGDISQLDSMIVTTEDYERLYSKEKNRRILTGLISKYSMLFLGFSMSDSYFSKELKSISDSNSGYGTNYMVLIDGDTSTEKKVLDSNNVKFINIVTDSKNEDSFDVKTQYKFLFNFLCGNIFDKSV